MNSLVLIENNQFIGTSSYWKSRSKEFNDFGEIVSIYLLPEHMGKGYGKLLFEVTLNELVKTGYQNVFLWVLEENMRADVFTKSKILNFQINLIV